MYTVPDNSSSVHHHCPSCLQPHIVAIVSEETIVVGHRLALLMDRREEGRGEGEGGRGREGGMEGEGGKGREGGREGGEVMV